MLYRHATVEDIPEIAKLQEKYHVNTVSPEDKPDGFVTTLFTPEQFKALIEEENGITLAIDDESEAASGGESDRENDSESAKVPGGKIAGYAMAASWQYWSAWPLFAYMIEDLPKTTYRGVTMSVDNSYQYGPIAIDKPYRGKGVMKGLFDYSLASMAERYPYMLTFVNQINPRSYEAHTRKAGCDVVNTFEFNNNKYWELGKPTRS